MTWTTDIKLLEALCTPCSQMIKVLKKYTQNWDKFILYIIL